jgi:plastocyanin
MAPRSVVSFATLAAFSLVLTSALTLPACAEDETTPGPKPDSGATPIDAAGGGVDSSVPATDAGDAGDAGPQPNGPLINDCSVYVDRTDAAASRTLQWDLAVNSLPHHCMRIKVGQTLKLVNGAAVADFVAHPVATVKEPEKTAGPVVDEATGTVTFTTAAAFQVNCLVHPTMKVVIVVVP